MREQQRETLQENYAKTIPKDKKETKQQQQQQQQQQQKHKSSNNKTTNKHLPGQQYSKQNFLKTRVL